MSNTLKTILILSFFCLALCEEQKIEIVGKVVEIEPVALDVVIPLYENVVVLFHRGTTSETAVSMFETATSEMNLPPRILNKTLFGICDMEKDQAGHLNKYEVSGEGIKFITQINQYDLSIPRETSL